MRYLATITLMTTLALTGCYKVTYKSGLAGGGATHSKKVTHFLWGAAGGGEVDAAASCPDGVASIHEQKSFIDQLLSGVTGFLYSPTTVQIECAGTKTSAR